jgi:hypothetical protein
MRVLAGTHRVNRPPNAGGRVMVNTTRQARRLAIVASLLLGSGCSLLQNVTAPAIGGTTEAFVGRLTQQGSSTFTFTVTQPGPVTVTLSTMSPATTLGVGLGVGTPTGTAGCALTTSTANAVSGSAAAISLNGEPGALCVTIYDVGNLTGESLFTVAVTHL